MSKSIIYAGSNNTQATTVNGVVVAFNSIVRRYGDNMSISGGNVVLQGGGYYKIDVNITATGTAAGDLLIQVFKDGVAVPYANATITTTADNTTSVTIPCFIRECGCGCNCSTVTVVASGVVANITNAAIAIEKE